MFRNKVSSSRAVNISVKVMEKNFSHKRAQNLERSSQGLKHVTQKLKKPISKIA